MHIVQVFGSMVTIPSMAAAPATLATSVVAEVRRIVARPGLRDGAAVSISAHYLGHQDRNWFGVLRPSLASREQDRQWRSRSHSSAGPGEGIGKVESVGILSPVPAHLVIITSTSSQGPKALLSCFTDLYRASIEPPPDARINQLLDQARFAHVAVISDGDPYVGPPSFVRHGDALYFRTAAGERVDALQVHPRAAVSIVEFDVETGSWESVLVRGDVSFLGSDWSNDAVVVLFLEKYREYGSHLGSGLRLDTEDAAVGWVGTPEVASDEAIVFSLLIREVAGRTSGRWMTPGTRPGRL